MIFLKVEDYCHNCPDFEADVKTSCAEHWDMERHSYIRLVNTLITCEHCDRCACQMKYLEDQKRKEEQK